MLNKLYHKGAEIKSAFLNGVMVFGNSESIPEATDQGLAKDYSGTGWYKATDTGVVYNKDIPEGETHTFDGDPIEYISVWRNEGFDENTFEGTEEDIQQLLEWQKNLHRYATSNVTDMSYWVYVYGAMEDVPVESDITNASIVNHYDTSNVTNMSHMFESSPIFNQPLDNFNTSNVTNMADMFNRAQTFNQPLDNFDTSSVTDMGGMFSNARSFNQPLDNFDTSKVTNMAGMFSDATAFNQDISNWNTSNVTNMMSMFAVAASFNGDISKWDTSKVTGMTSMFTAATSFNQDISSWDVSNVTDMRGMFNNIVTPSAPFNQDLSQWCVTNITTEPENFALGLESWTLPKPVWGTCPRGEDGS